MFNKINITVCKSEEINLPDGLHSYCLFIELVKNKPVLLFRSTKIGKYK